MIFDEINDKTYKHTIFIVKIPA